MIEPRKPSHDVLAALRRKYLARLHLQIDELNRTWRPLADGRGARSEIDPFYRLVHTMAGSGTFFGFRDLSDAARDLEVGLVEIMEQAAPLTAAQRRNIGTLFDKLKAVVAASTSSIDQAS